MDYTDYLSLRKPAVGDPILIGDINYNADALDAYLSKLSASISNANLLDNPNFAVNQRDVSGTISTYGYFVDRWILVSGTVTINSNGSITLNGTISQKLETAAGATTTVSVITTRGTATASYDNLTKTYTIVSSDGVITAAKLECGTVKTPYVPPNPAEELLKCQRYYINLTSGYSRWLISNHIGANNVYFDLPLPCSMRSNPSLVGTPQMFNGSNDDSGYTWTVLRYPYSGAAKLTATKANHGNTDPYVDLVNCSLSADL